VALIKQLHIHEISIPFNIFDSLLATRFHSSILATKG
jgi:hypothetical protein